MTVFWNRFCFCQIQGHVAVRPFMIAKSEVYWLLTRRKKHLLAFVCLIMLSASPIARYALVFMIKAPT